MNDPLIPTQRGFSLVELMVSLTLGLLVALALTGVYRANSGHYRQAEQFARMQDAGRYALDMLVRDLSLADFWGGFGGEIIDSGAAVIPLATDCGPAGISRWAFKTANAIEYFIPASLADSPTAHFGCIQDADEYAYRPGTNVLAVKHVTGYCASKQQDKSGNYICPDRDNAAKYEAAKSGHVYVRPGTNVPLFILSDGTTPATDIDRDYVVHIYYIAVDLATGIPSLRRKRLTHNGGNPAIEEDEGELVEGVEFFHIQFGVDGSDQLATIPATTEKELNDARCDADNYLERYRSISDTYMSSDHTLRCAVSARIYVLVRSIERDTSLPEDSKRYDLGRIDAAQAVAGKDTFGDQFQRRVYTTTVQLRNRVYQSAIRQALPK